MKTRGAFFFILALALSIDGTMVRLLWAQDAASLQADLELNPLANINLSSLVGFRSKPLFSPSRTPPVQDEPIKTSTDTTADPTNILNIRLLGVVMTPGNAIAHVQDLDDVSTRVVKVGDTIDAWTITTIGSAGLEMKKDGEVKYFALFQTAKP